jgi:predicted phosphodiesterase
MRVFAISDIHVDYDVNMRWVHGLSDADYRDDLLILAGDVTHRPRLLAECLGAFRQRFAQVLFVPGNHDLWVVGEAPGKHSLHKFQEVAGIVRDCGASMAPYARDRTLILPLLGWYDYSFGEPDDDLRQRWADFHACRWPDGYEAAEIAAVFDDMNEALPAADGRRVITFSHFLPRIDLVPSYVPRKHRTLDPVLGSVRIERRLRRFSPDIHVYGHSHINRSVRIEDVHYVNNAFGYPQESAIASKRLLCIDEI